MKPLPRGCNGKQAFQSAKAARLAMICITRRRGSDPLAAYSCKVCKQWHLGRQKSGKSGKRTPDHARNSEKNRRARYEELAN